MRDEETSEPERRIDRLVELLVERSTDGGLQWDFYPATESFGTTVWNYHISVDHTVRFLSDGQGGGESAGGVSITITDPSDQTVDTVFYREHSKYASLLMDMTDQIRREKLHADIILDDIIERLENLEDFH